jgi:two-component system response regulator FixJ
LTQITVWVNNLLIEGWIDSTIAAQLSRLLGRRRLVEAQPVVFVVDSDAAAVDSLAAMLGPQGLAVKAYSSAERFLEGFDRSQCGCLVVDVQTAGMGSLELQERLRAEEIHLPVIAVATRSNVRMAVHAIRHGAVDFLEKPYGDYELCQSIHRALRLRWSQHLAGGAR